jgi:NADPH-dependent glutamate synthase beta subunit-like oxidoreductase
MIMHEDKLTPADSLLDKTEPQRIDPPSQAGDPDLSIRPVQLQKHPPCQAGCPNSGDIRGWLGVIAQHEKLGLSLETAYGQAWEKIVECNPLPATLGRICPHPCETSCTRGDKDGAVAINALERFLGDWGLEKALPLPTTEEAARSESVGVIGAGPAGLSFAYQMRRRGYPVTIYEKYSEPGGMLRYDIPGFRLPEAILAQEIQRILDLGIELKVGIDVGRDISLDELRSRHSALFLGMGAQRSRRLGIPGERGPGAWSGIEYLRLRKCGAGVKLGDRVAVIGGGNTAIDAARTARRDGAEVTVLYRRTRAEMPAIAAEIEDALIEGITIEFLVAPTAIIRERDAVRAMALQRMELGEADSSGRRRPVAIPGTEHQLMVDAVIVAVSQALDWGDLAHAPTSEGWVTTDANGKLDDQLWAGGDNRGPGIAGLAIAQGRHAAEAVHAELRGLPAQDAASDDPIPRKQVKTDFYETQRPLVRPRRPAEQWLKQPDVEIDQTINSDEVRREAARCLSCGQCFGCQQCWMFCNAGGFFHLAEVKPGAYFALITDQCEGCGKCIEVCPSGFLSVSRGSAS